MDTILVWRSLFAKFGALIGPLSTDLLFARSLAAHESAFPWLPQAAPGGMRALFDEFERGLEARTPEEILAANTALLATYTRSLADLIGPGLVVRFVQAAFPQDGSSQDC